MDLIRLEGEGNSVVLRITGEEGETLAGELVLESAFVRGSLRLWLSHEDLRAWLDVLDTLDGGHDVLWLEGGRSPEILLTRDDEYERLHFTVNDRTASMTNATITVPIDDAWFDDAYKRLDQVWTTWPLAED